MASATSGGLEEQLGQHLAGFSAAPVLFVGSGISLRYLGLPNWTDLLRHLASFAEQEFDYYSSTADGHAPEIATLLAPELHKYLWQPEQQDLRDKYKGHLTTHESAIKILTCEHLQTSIDPDWRNGPHADELSLLGQAVIDVAITTNYDPLLTDVLPGFKPIIGQQQLLFSEPVGAGEIYHVHGSVGDPNSLVLTSADYGQFNERNAYLVAKLITMFAEHPVVFLGYSLSDPNIIQMLTDLAATLTRDNVHRLQDRLIFVQWQPGATATMTGTVIPVGGGVSIPVLSVVAGDFLDVFRALAGVKRKFSGRTLRLIRERIYELVRTNDPKGMMYVVDPTDGKLADDVQVVFGVGAIDALKSYSPPVDRIDLLRDLLHDDRGYDAEKVCQHTFPLLLKSAGNFPMAKYLRAAGHLDGAGAIKDPAALPDKVVDRWNEGPQRYLPVQSIAKAASNAAAKAKTFGKLRDTLKPHEVINYFGALPPGKIRVRRLRDFLIGQEPGKLRDDYAESNFAKAICLLDRLEYGGHHPW